VRKGVGEELKYDGHEPPKRRSRVEGRGLAVRVEGAFSERSQGMGDDADRQKPNIKSPSDSSATGRGYRPPSLSVQMLLPSLCIRAKTA
jgi:hypothetical protein